MPVIGSQVIVRAYASPTLVLLALDWPEGKDHPDFLGFAISRSPGYAAGEQDAWLLNKIGFTPPQADSTPQPSNLAPIQKFLWWDSGITTQQRGNTLSYTVTPVLGTSSRDLQLQSGVARTCKVTVPKLVEKGIGTYFNRAVVSSQAFSREFPDPAKELEAAMDWLANGLQDAIPDFLKGSRRVDGAIYHLTDNRWVIPKLKTVRGSRSLVYFWKEPSKNGKGGDTVNQYAANVLKRAGYDLYKRTKAAIMHDKFLVRSGNGRPSAVLMGSANFTPEGLTSQANVLHTFESAALAKLYAARQVALETDPTIPNLAKTTGWSSPVSVGGAKVRAFFPPEPGKSRVSIDTVTKAVKAAQGSVIFCMFSPTDAALLKGLLDSGDRGKIMFGLLNSISDPSKSKKRLQAIADGQDPGPLSESARIQVDIYHRSRRDHKVLAYDYYSAATAPAGFLPEFSTIDTSKWSVAPKPKPAKKGSKRTFVPAVHIHHKFIVIDAHTKTPTIFTGSANMSNNSTHRNDENLLEISLSAELAQLYLAEFLRLYEHYRARAIWNETHTATGKKKAKKGSGVASAHEALVLRTSRDKWVRGAYRRGTPEYRARTVLASPPSRN